MTTDEQISKLAVLVEDLKKGFYLARIHDEEFELAVPRGFKPKSFHPKAR